MTIGQVNEKIRFVLCNSKCFCIFLLIHLSSTLYLLSFPGSLQSSFLFHDLLTNVIILNLLPRPQTPLQRLANLDSRNGTSQLERRLLAIQDALRKLIRLGNERLLEAIIVCLRHLFPDTTRLVELDEVLLWVSIDDDLAMRADDFGSVLLAGCHHARGVEVGDFAAVEFYNTDTVVDVAVLCEAGETGVDADRCDTFDDAVLAKVPQREIDVVDVGVL